MGFLSERKTTWLHEAELRSGSFFFQQIFKEIKISYIRFSVIVVAKRQLCLEWYKVCNFCFGTFKGSVARDWDLPTYVCNVVQWVCVRRGAAEGFYNLLLRPRLLKNIKRNTMLQRRRMKIVTFLLIAIRKCCFVCYWLTASFSRIFFYHT